MAQEKKRGKSSRGPLGPRRDEPRALSPAAARDSASIARNLKRFDSGALPEAEVGRIAREGAIRQAKVRVDEARVERNLRNSLGRELSPDQRQDIAKVEAQRLQRERIAAKRGERGISPPGQRMEIGDQAAIDEYTQPGPQRGDRNVW
jgi:hypothetical protein